MATDIKAKISLGGENEFQRAVKNVNSNLKELDSELKLVSKQYSENGNSIEAYVKKKEILNKKIEEQSKKIELQNKQFEDAKKKYNDLARAVEEYKKKLEEARTSGNAEQIKELEGKLEGTEKAFIKAGQSVKSWQTTLNNSRSTLIDYQNSLENLNTPFDNIVRRFSDVGEKLTSLGKTMSLAITAPITAISAASIKTGMEFERSLSQVQATMGLEKTSEEMEMIKQKSSELGETTQFSASQAAEAFNYLALAGNNAQESISAIPDTLNIALAGDLDLAYATDLITDSMSALGLETSELTDFADKLAVTSQKSNTNIAQLGQGILTVGGTAKNLKGGVTELAAELGILADNGIKGAEGGTLLRNTILSLTAGTDAAKKQIKALGLEVFDSSGNLRALNDIFTDLDGILSTMTQEEKTNVLNTIFNKVDLKGVEALLANSTTRFAELSAAIDNSNGAAQKMADTMADNFSGSVKSLQSKLESLQNEAFELLLPKLNDLADAVMNFLDWLQSLDEETKKQIIDWGLFVAALGPVLVILGQVAAAVGNVAKAVKSASSTIKTIAPFAPLIIGGSALAVLLKETVGRALSDTITAIGGVMDRAEEARNSISSSTSQVISDCENIKTAYEKTKQSVEEINANYDKQAEKIDATSVSAKNLVKRLEELGNQTDLTEDEQKEMQTAVSQLNALFPDLNLSIDENTGALSKNTAEIWSNIEAMKARAVQKAYGDKFQLLTTEQVNLDDNLSETQEQKKQLEKLIKEKEAQDKYYDRVMEGYRKGETIIDPETGLETYRYSEAEYQNAYNRRNNADLKNLRAQYDDIVKQESSLKTDIQNNQKELDRITEKLGEQSYNIGGGASGGTNLGAKLGVDEWAAHRKERLDWIKERNSLNDWEAFETNEADSYKSILDDLNEYYREGLISLKRYNEEKADLDEKRAAAQKKLIDEWTAYREERLDWIKERNSLNDWEAFETNEADSYKSLLDDLNGYYRDGLISLKRYNMEKADLDAKRVDAQKKSNTNEAESEAEKQKQTEKAAKEQEKIENEKLKAIEEAEKAEEKTREEAEKERIEKLNKEFESKQNFSQKWINSRSLRNDWENFSTTEADSYGRMIERIGEFYEKGAYDYEAYTDKIASLTESLTDKEADFYENLFAYINQQYKDGVLKQQEYNSIMYSVFDMQYEAQQKAVAKAREDTINNTEAALSLMLNKKQQEIQEVTNQLDNQVSKLRNQWAAEDREKSLGELYEESAKYRKSVTISGQEHYRDIQEQIKQIQREQEIADLEAKNNEIIESMQKQYQEMETRKNALLEQISQKIEENQANISQTITSLQEAIVNTFNNLEGMLSGRGTTIYNYNTTNTNSSQQTFNTTLHDNVDADIFSRTIKLDKLRT